MAAGWIWGFEALVLVFGASASQVYALCIVPKGWNVPGQVNWRDTAASIPD